MKPKSGKEFEKLRVKCKVLMIHSGLDKRGGQKFISGELGIERMSLNHALCGARDGPKYLEILEKVHAYLKKNR